MKHFYFDTVVDILGSVAIVLTVYGIETKRIRYIVTNSKVAIVLTVYGIETSSRVSAQVQSLSIWVAIVLTVYGIETAECCRVFFIKTI